MRFHADEFHFRDGPAFLVQCPACKHQAVVLTDVDPALADQSSIRLACSHCGHSEIWSPSSWQGPSHGFVRHWCKSCGRRMEKGFSRARGNYLARLQCANCGAVMHAPIEWQQSYRSFPSDPYFGCRLWLIGRVKGEIFWATNREYLAFLRGYVAGMLRIRAPNHNRSLASRLPLFLKSKKNRVAVLKEIARLEKL